jgi:Fe-S-cluster containining protein
MPKSESVARAEHLAMIRGGEYYPVDYDGAGKTFNCDYCIGMCCTIFQEVPLAPKEITRLAKHFALSHEDFLAQYCYYNADEQWWALKKQEDPVLHAPRACTMLDLTTRRCTVYHERPGICRHLDGTQACGFYDTLQAYRANERDPNAVAFALVDTGVQFVPLAMRRKK